VPRNLSTNRPIEKVEMTITKIDPSDVKESNNNLSDAIISPNPATDYININVGDRLACSEDLKIYNAMGECVMNLTPALSEGEGARIDVSQLAAGVYFVKAGDRVEKFTKI
jgi:hypothetical protein